MAFTLAKHRNIAHPPLSPSLIKPKEFSKDNYPLNHAKNENKSFQGNAEEKPLLV